MSGFTHLLSLLQKNVEAFPFVRVGALMQTVNSPEEDVELISWLVLVILVGITKLFFLRVCQSCDIPESTKT